MYFYLLLFQFLINIINCINIKNVKFDYYYEVKLSEYNGELYKNVTDIHNQTIIKVSSSNYDELLYTGSGILPNGKIINLINRKEYNFEYIDSKYNYTVGSNDNELIPNRSVSTNLFELGTFIYIPNFNLLNISKITKDGCF